jgi:3-methylfumaryl-CoA hydratase
MTDWESWIGRSTSSTATLDPEQANRMAVTLDREPTFRSGDPLPPAWQWLYFHDIVRASQLGEEGHPQLGVTMPPVPLPRRMWAGGQFDFAEPMRLGARVERVSTIRSITPKSGKSGPLYFVSVEHEFSSDGEHNLLEKQTIVYREMSSTAEPTRAAPAPTDPEFATTWELDNTALFRYSALTFNGHRIHYDADYSRAVEGYPNIVIHGPLLATLLLDLAYREKRPMRRFSYRARSPLFLPSPFTVNGSSNGEDTTLWAANPSGGLAMEADIVGGPAT